MVFKTIEVVRETSDNLHRWSGLRESIERRVVVEDGMNAADAKRVKLSGRRMI